MSKDLMDLEEETGKRVVQLITNMATLGHPVEAVHTYRSNEEQALLYQKGRTRPGEPCLHGKVRRPVGTCSEHPLGATVTNAGPGTSWHNFRRACDLAFRVKPGPLGLSWADTLPWDLLRQEALKLGLECGVRLKTGELTDLGHVQFRGGMTLAQLRREGGFKVA